MNRFFLYFALIFSFLCTGCSAEPIYVGNSFSGYKTLPENQITPVEAIKIAEPYLDKTFELRYKNREIRTFDEPLVHIVQKNGWYYVVRDNYPAKSVYFYINHAVKINTKTGELKKPE